MRARCWAASSRRCRLRDASTWRGVLNLKLNPKRAAGLLAFVLLSVLGAALNWRLRTAHERADGSNVLEFMAANPRRAALWARRDGDVVADFHAERVMPLASTVKVLIAIEYAQQAASGRLQPDEMVALADLDKYFLPATDGGAQAGWLKFARGSHLITNERARLDDVVRGMLQFSSNANADWLIERLGLDRINATIGRLGLKGTRLYSFVGSLAVVGAHGEDSPAAWAQAMRALPDAEFERRANEAHQKLRDDAGGSFKKAFVFPNAEEQKVWSDRLPAASARSYGELMGKINGRKYFAPKVQQFLDSVLEWPLQASPEARKAYAHLGFKGGSTAWILTQAFYGQAQGGDKVEGAILFNDLTPAESENLQGGLDAFIAGLFRDEALRRKLKALK